MTKEVERLKARIKKLKDERKIILKNAMRIYKALEFYAHPDTWFATSLLTDPPCGDIAKDYGDSGTYYGVCLGKRARKALKIQYDWEHTDEVKEMWNRFRRNLK